MIPKNYLSVLIQNIFLNSLELIMNIKSSHINSYRLILYQKTEK